MLSDSLFPDLDCVAVNEASSTSPGLRLASIAGGRRSVALADRSLRSSNVVSLKPTIDLNLQRLPPSNHTRMTTIVDSLHLTPSAGAIYTSSATLEQSVLDLCASFR